MLRVLRFMPVLPALFLLSACGTGVAGGSVTGQYTCTDSVLDAVSLMPGGKALRPPRCSARRGRSMGATPFKATK